MCISFKLDSPASVIFGSSTCNVLCSGEVTRSFERRSLLFSCSCLAFVSYDVEDIYNPNYLIGEERTRSSFKPVRPPCGLSSIYDRTQIVYSSVPRLIMKVIVFSFELCTVSILSSS